MSVFSYVLVYLQGNYPEEGFSGQTLSVLMIFLILRNSSLYSLANSHIFLQFEYMPIFLQRPQENMLLNVLEFLPISQVKKKKEISLNLYFSYFF